MCIGQDGVLARLTTLHNINGEDASFFSRFLHTALCTNLYTIFIVDVLFHVVPAMYFGLMLEYVLFKLN